MNKKIRITRIQTIINKISKLTHNELWILSKESGFTSKEMGQIFIDNIDLLFEKWEPQPRFHLIKVRGPQIKQ